MNLQENRPIPEPASNEVLIDVKFVGICGSDIIIWKHGCHGDTVIKEPMVLGHEGSGVIVKVGENVKGLKPGDRVCMEPAIPCRICDICKNGRYNLCPYVKGCSTPDHPGFLCEYYCYPADLCYKLPENISLEEGALMEPFAVGVHATRRAGVTAGKSVLICGAGPIGLVNLITCKALGVSKICITDICESRLNAAKELGSTHEICVKDKNMNAVMEEIKRSLGGSPDITIECSGVQSSIKMGILVTKRGGVHTQVGQSALDVSIPIIDATVREIDIRGSFRYANDFPVALDLLASGTVDLKPLISHKFKLKETLKAFETASTPSDGAVKVLISCENA